MRYPSACNQYVKYRVLYSAAHLFLSSIFCGRLHLGQSPELVKEYSLAFEIHYSFPNCSMQSYYINRHKTK